MKDAQKWGIWSTTSLKYLYYSYSQGSIRDITAKDFGKKIITQLMLLRQGVWRTGKKALSICNIIYVQNLFNKLNISLSDSLSLIHNLMCVLSNHLQTLTKKAISAKNVQVQKNVSLISADIFPR